MDLRIRSFKQAAFWSTAINAFSQGLALVFSMVMAAYFGAVEGTDILYYGIGLIALASLLVQAVNVGVLIPETMRRRHQVGEADAMAFINRFFAVFGLLTLLLTAGLGWKPVESLELVSRFSPEALRRNSNLIGWLVVSFPLQMAAQLLLDVLVSYRFLTLPAALSCVNRLINVLFILAFHRSLGVAAVALGMALGFGLQVLLNLCLLRRVIHWRPLAWRTRVGGAVFRNIAWVELGTAVSALAIYVPLLLFSGFAAGAMTVLNYARRMSNMPMELLTSQMSSVASVKFNEQAARRDDGGMAATFGWLQRQLVLFLVPLAFLLALAGGPIIAILFGRGAFDAAAVAETARLFSVLMLALPLLAVDSVVARLFIARQEVAFGTRCQIFGSVLSLALLYGFVKGMGPLGFAIGTVFSRGLYLLVLAQVFPARLAPVTLWPTVRSLGATAAACGAVAWAAGRGADWVLPADAGPWLVGSTLCGLFGMGYGAVLWVLPPDRRGREEGRALVQAAVRRLRRGARPAGEGSQP